MGMTMPETIFRENPAKNPGPNPGLRKFHMAVPQDSRLRLFFSNLIEFLTARPAKFRTGSKPPFFTYSSFGAGLIDNLKEQFRPVPRTSSGAGASELLIPWDTSFPSFWQNLRDAIFPPKLPPIQVSSEPVEVPEIWRPDPQFKRVQALSLAMHIVLLVLIIVPLLPEIMSPPTTRAWPCSPSWWPGSRRTAE